jgi:hypothetical protein
MELLLDPIARAAMKGPAHLRGTVDRSAEGPPPDDDASCRVTFFVEPLSRICRDMILTQSCESVDRRVTLNTQSCQMGVAWLPTKLLMAGSAGADAGQAKEKDVLAPPYPPA